MKKTKPTSIVLVALILVAGVPFLGACSGSDPTAPVAGSDDPSLVGADKSAQGMPTPRWENANFHGLGQATYANARKVAQAARRFAADNDGIPPSSLHDTNPTGRKFLDYFPGGHRLRNPFTRVRNNPIIDEYPCCAGGIGYTPIINHQAVNVGFIVAARGATPDQEFIIEWYTEGYGPSPVLDADSENVTGVPAP